MVDLKETMSFCFTENDYINDHNQNNPRLTNPSETSTTLYASYIQPSTTCDSFSYHNRDIAQEIGRGRADDKCLCEFGLGALSVSYPFKP